MKLDPPASYCYKFMNTLFQREIHKLLMQAEKEEIAQRLFDAKRAVGLLTPADQAARAMQMKMRNIHPGSVSSFAGGSLWHALSKKHPAGIADASHSASS